MKEKNYWDNLYQNYHQNGENKRKSVWSETASEFLINSIPFFKSNGVKKIMDAGCGDGRNMIPFLEEGIEVVGIDFSIKSLIYARKNLKNYNNFELFPFSLENIFLEKESFDAIFCENTLTHFRDVGKVLEQFYKLLKPKGFVSLEFTSVKDPSFGTGENVGKNKFVRNGLFFRLYEPEECEKIVLDSGFKIIEHFHGSYTHPSHGAVCVGDSKFHVHESEYILAQKC